MKRKGLPARLSLRYELEPGDLEDTQAVTAGRRRRQVRALVVTVPVAAFCVAVIALTVGSPAVTGAPDWLYAADAVGLALLAIQVRAAWRLSPKRLAWIIWRANPGYRGRHLEEIDERGVTWTPPAGSQIFVPWSVVVGIHETERAFHLMDDTGNVRSSLPKRGLASPDLVPVLRDLLNSSAGSQPSAATAV